MAGEVNTATCTRITRVTCVQALLELHLVAQQHEDTHTSTFIQTSFLNPQVILPPVPPPMPILPPTLPPSSLPSICISLAMSVRFFITNKSIETKRSLLDAF